MIPRKMRRNADSKATHQEVQGSRAREKELERRRREWAIEQERAREHERRKQKMIQEYEERRAKELGHQSRSRTSRPSKSSTRSQSSESKTASKSDTCSRSLVMSERFDAASSNTPLFKGPEGTKIPLAELKKIKVDIHRNLSSDEPADELNRDIVLAEDVIVKRREGEGQKPIFERAELKSTGGKSCDEEERRTVVSVSTAKSPDASRRRSRSKSPRHRRSRSPRRDLRSHTGSRSHRERSDYHEESRHRSRERHEHSRRGLERVRDYSRRRSSSLDREGHRTRDPRAYEDSRSRRYDESLDRSRRMRLPHPYIEPIPVPFYYGNYARPLMIDPMMAMRGPMPVPRGRLPPVMGGVRPSFGPRFISPEMFRSGGMQHPRFNRMM